MPMTRDNVFDRLQVDSIVRGGTRVSWRLSYLFTDLPPYLFRLQRGQTGSPGADDWADVGPPLPDVGSAIDRTQSLHGLTPTTHYRVVLTTGGTTPGGRATHISEPINAFGELPARDWLIAREIIRKESLRDGTLASSAGLLLKRRQAGAGQPAAEVADPRRAVLDPLTGDIVRRQGAVDTQGTPYLGGYFAPVPYAVDFDLAGSTGGVDAGGAGEADADPEAVARTGRASAFPRPERGDVFIESSTDARYTVRGVRFIAALRNVPIICRLTLVQAAFDDLIYRLDPSEL